MTKADFFFEKASNPDDERPAPAAADDRPALPAGSQRRSSSRLTIPVYAAAGLSIAWIGALAMLMIEHGGTEALAAQAPLEWLAVAGGACGPLVLFWIIALVMQRSDPLLEHRFNIAQNTRRVLHPVEDAERRLAELSKKLGRDAAQIESATDIATSRINNLEERFRSEIADLFSASADAEAKAISLKDTLRRERDALTELTHSVDDRLDRLKNSVDGFTHRLHDSLDAATISAEAAAERARGYSDDIERAQNAMLDRLSSTGQTLSDQAHQLLDDSKSLDERLHGLIGAIAQRSDDIIGTMAQLREEGQSVHDAFARHADDINRLATQSLRDTERHREAMAEGGEALTKQVTGALTALNDAGESFRRQAEECAAVTRTSFTDGVSAAKAATADLRDHLDGLEQHTGETLAAIRSQFSDTRTQMQAETEALKQAAEKTGEEALASLKAAGETYRGLIAELNAQSTLLAEETGGRVTAVADTLADRLETLGAAGDKAARALNHHIDDFFSHITRLQKDGAEAGTMFTQATQTLADARRDYQQMLDDLEQQLARIREEIAAGRSAFADAQGDHEQRLDKVGELYRQLTGDMGDRGTRTITRLESALDAMSGRSETVFAELEALIAGLGKEVEAFDRSSEASRRISSEAAIHISGQRERIAGMLDDIRGDVGKATLAITEDLTSRQEATAALLDSLRRDLDTAGAAMQDQLAARRRDAGTEMAEIKAHLEATGAAMQDEIAIRQQRAKAQLEGLLSDIAAVVAGVNDDVDERSRDATKALEALRRDVEHANDNLTRRVSEQRDLVAQELQTVTATVEDQTGIMRDLVRQAAGAVAQNTQDLVAEGRAQMNSVADMTEGLRKRIDAVIDTAELSRIASEDAMKRVDQRIQQSVEAASGNLGERVAGLSGRLETELRALQQRFGATIDDLINNMETATARANSAGVSISTNLGKEADRLLDTAQTITRRAEEIERMIVESTRDEFARTTTLLMESLKSLSIDLNKVFDADVPDTIWQRYMDGDKAVFARRILQADAKSARRAIAERFEADTEYRQHVLKFCQDFELLMERVMAGDRGSVMSVSLLSSDIGKLYLLLAQALKKIA